MRLLILRSSCCILFAVLFVFAVTNETTAKELTWSNVASRAAGGSHRPVKQLGKRRLPALEVVEGLQARAEYTNGKKSLWRSASTVARSLKEKFARDSPPMRTMVKRDQVSDFCSRFSTNCTNYCKKLNLTSKSYLCSQASSTSSALGLNVRCKCGTTDYTANVLLNQAPSGAVKIAATAQATTVQTVTKTSTIRATSSICKTISTTTTLPGTTTTTTTSTTLPTITSTIISRSTLSPTTGTTTRLTTVTSTVVVTNGATAGAVTSTTTIYTTAYSTTVQVVAQGGNSAAVISSSSKAKTSSTSTKKTTSSSKKTTSTKKTTSSTKKSTATAKARDLDEDEDEEVELHQLGKRAATFCQAYLSACNTACVGHNGPSTSKCTVASTNSYSLSCICKDGTSESRKALNVAQADVSSTTTQTMTNTVTTVRYTTASTTVRTTTTTTATVDGPQETDTFTQFLQYITATTTTTTRPATTTYWRTVTSTIGALTTTTSTSTTTPKVVNTLYKTTTVISTKTSTSTKATTTSTTSSTQTTSTSTVSTDSAGPSQIQVRDYTSSSVYGLLSASQDEDAYAFLLDSTSQDGMFVNVIASTVSSSISGLVGLQMNDTSDYGSFNYVGFEVQDLSDTGVQPNMLEYLLLTDTAPVSTTSYPSTSNSDTGYFAAEAFVWTKSTSGKLTPYWTNPSGSSTATATMQMFMLCSGSGYSDCFVSAAYNSTTWTNFDTSGVTITRVQLVVV
ncbi:hypothetical protein BCV69DRAFT_1386 [Microstroma glucosiphilum]|uniref:Uncharacterized protein n=1 Tax=Pseudomicrostroma glucosiphilum TaxID=1684307 RepID=A0A316UE31_9BASI|nr:hypothetical protein BCV69DRAFT_1386 [Pseudomicrostroma glucosiphilum]PWN23527.1 hypothetical protein BCV69DRAFT_1386 [Pseudomicrostroma glucosiphilum]